MKNIILHCLVGFFAAHATAAEVWSIQKIEPSTPINSLTKKMNLPVETRIDHPLFSVQAPKSWSCGQGADSQVEVLTCTPTTNIEKSTTLLAINRRYGQSKHTLQGNFDALIKNPKRRTSKKVLNGTEWVFSVQEIEEGQQISMLSRVIL